MAIQELQVLSWQAEILVNSQLRPSCDRAAVRCHFPFNLGATRQRQVGAQWFRGTESVNSVRLTVEMQFSSHTGSQETRMMRSLTGGVLVFLLSKDLADDTCLASCIVRQPQRPILCFIPLQHG
jgi:hypothetical protein